MAITIYTTQENAQYYLTSEHLYASISASYRTRAILYCTDPSKVEPVKILDVDLTSADGTVTLWGINKVVKEYFQANGIVMAKVGLYMEDDYTEMNFLYSDFALDDNFDPETALLSPARVQYVYASSHVVMQAFKREGCQYEIVAYGSRSDRDEIGIARFSYDLPLNNKCWADFSVKDIISRAKSNGLNDVKMFAIRYGDAIKTFFVREGVPTLSFRFRNAFNIPEYLDLCGTLTNKVEASRGVAVVGGRRVGYDHNTKITYELNVAHVPREMMLTCAQLIQSPKVQIWQNPIMREIIITDADFAPSTDDDALATMKLQFKYSNTSPAILEPNDRLENNTRNVFSSQFSPEYD